MAALRHHAYWVAWHQRIQYRRIDQHQNFELLVADDVKVRTMRLPPRNYSAKELKELKGNDPRLPGYTSDFNFLASQQVVDVYLAPGTVVGAPPGSADAAMKVDPRPRVVMIVVE